MGENPSLCLIEELCTEKKLRMTDQRRVIARVLSDASEAREHPDVEEVHARCLRTDPDLSIATVYRTVRLFEEAGILERHDFGQGRYRYETVSEEHHDHLVNVKTGEIIEFRDLEIEALQKQIALDHGLNLVDHRMELYVRPLREGET